MHIGCHSHDEPLRLFCWSIPVVLINFFASIPLIVDSRESESIQSFNEVVEALTQTNSNSFLEINSGFMMNFFVVHLSSRIESEQTGTNNKTETTKFRQFQIGHQRCMLASILLSFWSILAILIEMLALCIQFSLNGCLLFGDKCLGIAFQFFNANRYRYTHIQWQ